MSDKTEDGSLGDRVTDLIALALAVMLVAAAAQYAIEPWMFIPFWRMAAIVYVARWVLMCIGPRPK